MILNYSSLSSGVTIQSETTQQQQQQQQQKQQQQQQQQQQPETEDNKVDPLCWLH